MTEPSLHGKLKYWLIELGNTMGYAKSYSGDSKPLIIQVGKWHETYQPDVIWRYRGGICVFEIAFTEDWPRAVVGEICLVSMVEDCTKIFIVSQSSEYSEVSEIYEKRWGTYVSMIGKKVGLKYGAEAIFVPHNAWKEERIEDIKNLICKRLKRHEWL